MRERERSPSKGLVLIYGTRPETIKLAPIYHAAAARGIDCVSIHTGQHTAERMTDRIARDVRLPPPRHQLAAGGVAPNLQLAAMIGALDPILAGLPGHVVVVQGDTNSTLAGAIAGNKRRLVVAHVEAGLRSYDRAMPEEVNRIIVDGIADVLFAPTAAQVEILVGEGVDSGRIHEVGNTIADAVLSLTATQGDIAPTLDHHRVERGRYALLSLHRPENVDRDGILADILSGVARACERHSMEALWPIHPRTADKIERAGLELPAAIRRVNPVGFRQMLHLELGARCVLTDSGGLQEESAILSVPCVTLRTSTERPETVRIGANILAGIRPDDIVAAVDRSVARSRGWVSPYGAGKTAEDILGVLERWLP